MQFLSKKDLKGLSPFAAVMICTHSAAGIISCELGLKGPKYDSIAAGCNSGLDAVYLAYNSIRLGDADIMLAGAGEAPITPYMFAFFVHAGFSRGTMENLKRALKPYDVNGDGIVLGEGGAVLVLEELQNAQEKKAKIYGEILGYASGNEAYNIFEIDPSGRWLHQS